MGRHLKSRNVFLGSGLSGPSRTVYYDDKTFELYVLTRKGGTTRRVYVRGAVYKRPIKRHSRYGGTIDVMRFFRSTKRRATKWNPKTGNYSRYDGVYQRKRSR